MVHWSLTINYCCLVTLFEIPHLANAKLKNTPSTYLGLLSTQQLLQWICPKLSSSSGFQSLSLQSELPGAKVMIIYLTL